VAEIHALPDPFAHIPSHDESGITPTEALAWISAEIKPLLLRALRGSFESLDGGHRLDQQHRLPRADLWSIIKERRKRGKDIVVPGILGGMV
jgi:hypothetical protein